MGFTINEKFETELHYQDVALISVAFSEKIERHEHTMNQDQLKRMNRLVDRLGVEMYDHPDNDIDISSEFERKLFKLINKYTSAGLKKPELVKKMEWVTDSCKTS